MRISRFLVAVLIASLLYSPLVRAQGNSLEVPATVSVNEVSAPADDKARADAKPAPTGVIKLESTPAGAEVWVDGKFVGNAPAQLKLAPGKHTIKVAAPGHQDWARELEVMADSEVSLRANLDATNAEPKP
jgi:hypothetical protein